MQDRYAGDIGDFVKLGLLRALRSNRKVGLAWYRFPDEAHNNDGRHITYLGQASRYAHLDGDLFKHLKTVADTGRTIASLLPALQGAVSADETLYTKNLPAAQRCDWRRAWFARVLAQLSDCDLVFADPDNGLVDDENWRKGSAKFGKQIPLAEAHALAQHRCAVLYHHNTRRLGGHDAEVDFWLAQFQMPAMAVRAKAHSPRTFFILNPDANMAARVKQFCSDWQPLKVHLHRNQR